MRSSEKRTMGRGEETCELGWRGSGVRYMEAENSRQATKPVRGGRPFSNTSFVSRLRPRVRAIPTDLEAAIC